MIDLTPVIASIRQFRNDRDWQQFHNPKNLAMSIAVEAAELMEHFLWKTPEESNRYAGQQQEAIADEMADIAKNLFLMADDLGIDLVQAIERKIQKDALKYPVEKAKGKALKYPML